LAQQYGKLPSEILAKGDTFDVLVFDVSATYKRQQQRKADGKTPDIDQMNPSQINDLSRKYYGKDAV